jgi:xanthine dehydrogenase accessory factor
MKTILHEMAGLLEKGEDFVLATIITRNGSAPRLTGAQMIVRRDGSIIGTIGGGLLEAQVLMESQAVFKSRSAIVQEYHFTGSDAALMDMICGGSQEVLVEFVDAGQDLMSRLCADALEALRRKEKAWWITAMPAKDSLSSPTSHWLVKVDGTLSSAVLPDSQNNTAIRLVAAASHADAIRLHLGNGQVDLADTHNPVLVQVESRRYLVAPLAVGGSVYIFGAGHVSQKLALLTSMVGFRTVVLDDRPEFANRQRFGAVDEVIVLKSFERAFEGLAIDNNSFIVIVTRGHLNDAKVLAQALNTGAGYIGMIGSKRKRELVYKELEHGGIPDEALRKVHSPIGIDIGADSPEEIAVSITAELIRVRADRNQA